MAAMHSFLGQLWPSKLTVCHCLTVIMSLTTLWKRFRQRQTQVSPKEKSSSEISGEMRRGGKTIPKCKSELGIGTDRSNNSPRARFQSETFSSEQDLCFRVTRRVFSFRGLSLEELFLSCYETLRRTSSPYQWQNQALLWDGCSRPRAFHCGWGKLLDWFPNFWLAWTLNTPETFNI